MDFLGWEHAFLPGFLLGTPCSELGPRCVRRHTCVPEPRGLSFRVGSRPLRLVYELIHVCIPRGIYPGLECAHLCLFLKLWSVPLVTNSHVFGVERICNVTQTSPPFWFRNVLIRVRSLSPPAPSARGNRQSGGKENGNSMSAWPRSRQPGHGSHPRGRGRADG